MDIPGRGTGGGRDSTSRTMSAMDSGLGRLLMALILPPSPAGREVGGGPAVVTVWLRSRTFLVVQGICSHLPHQMPCTRTCVRVEWAHGNSPGAVVRRRGFGVVGLGRAGLGQRGGPAQRRRPGR